MTDAHIHEQSTGCVKSSGVGRSDEGHFKYCCVLRQFNSAPKSRFTSDPSTLYLTLQLGLKIQTVQSCTLQ